MESEQVTPMDSIKDVVQSSVKVPQVQQTPEEGWRTYRLKRCRNNKDENNSLKTLNDKNHQASSQKVRQLIKRLVQIFVIVIFTLFNRIRNTIVLHSFIFFLY